MSCLIAFHLFFVAAFFVLEQLFQLVPSRIGSGLVTAAQLALFELFAAYGAKTGTILGAKQTVWKFKIYRFSQCLIHIEHTALDDKIILLILKLRKLFLACRSLGNERAFKADLERAFDRLKTPCALAAVRHVSLRYKTDIPSAVGNAAVNMSRRCVFNAVRRLGKRYLIVDRNFSDLTPKECRKIYKHFASQIR